MENKLINRRKEIEKTIVIFFVLIFLYLFTFPLIKFIKLKYEIRNLEREILLYKEKIDEIKKKIDFIKSDEGVERWVKENFKLVKDGEKIYIIKEKKVDWIIKN